MSECKCPCNVCANGYHIFCNLKPHGNKEEAEKFFKDNPDIAKTVKIRNEVDAKKIEKK